MARNDKRRPPPVTANLTSNPYDAPQTGELPPPSVRSTLKIIGLVFSLCFAVLLSIGLVLYTLAISFLTACSKALGGGSSSRPREDAQLHFITMTFWILIAASVAISIWLIYSLYRQRNK